MVSWEVVLRGWSSNALPSFFVYIQLLAIVIKAQYTVKNTISQPFLSALDTYMIPEVILF
jgi:hypothetical protein